MTEDFIISNIDIKDEDVVIYGGGKRAKIRKKDLKKIEPRVGDEVVLIKHSTFPNVVAALYLKGRCIFCKSREQVVDDYMKDQESILFQRLPKIARERVKMFSMFVDFYDKCDKLYEVLALSLGYRLFLQCESEEDIDIFGNQSVSEQIRKLPNLWHPVMPQISVDIIVDCAKAYLKDEIACLSGDKQEDLLNSAVMMLPSASSEKHGDLCVPRQEYIKKYLAATDTAN